MRGRKRKREIEKEKPREKTLRDSCLYAGLFLSRSGPHSPVALSRSLARIFRLLGPIPRLSPLHPSRTLDKPLKFWAPHCWKITGPLSSASASGSPRYSLSLTTIEYEHIELSLFISSSLHHSISSGSSLSALCPCRAAASAIRLLFRYSLLGSLFPL